MALAVHSLSTPEQRKLAVLMRMALAYADAAGAEPDAVKRSELLGGAAELLKHLRLLLVLSATNPLIDCPSVSRRLKCMCVPLPTASRPRA